MKYTALQPFLKHLRDAAPAHCASLYFLVAKEPHTRKEALKMVKEKLEGEWTVYEAKRLEPRILAEEVGSYTFFSRKRVICIDNIHELNKTTQTQLETLLEKPIADLTFVLSGESWNRGTKFYKNAEKQGVILDVPDEKPWEKERSIRQWLIDYVQKEGYQLQPEAVQLMLQQLGTDALLLEQELQKLFLYTIEKKRITIEDVTAICGVVNVRNIWQLGDAVLKRDSAQAISIAKALMADGLPFFSLMTQLRTQIQNKFQVCSILTTGGGLADVAAHFPYMKGRILEQNCQLAQGYGLERFRRAVITFADTELRAKSQNISDEWLTERLITHLSQ